MTRMSRARPGLGAGRSQEIEWLVDSELPSLLALAHALTGNRADAEDLVQDALVRGAQAPPDSMITKAYLRRIIVNLHVDRIRRAARENRANQYHLAVITTPTDQTGAVDVAVDLESDLRCLPPMHRSVLVLRFLEDLPFGEIADLLERPNGSCRRICHEALSLMRNRAAQRQTAIHRNGET